MPNLLSIASFIARRRLTLLTILFCSLAIPLSFINRLQIDNSIEVWLNRESPAFAAYQNFLSRFGSEEFVVVCAEGTTDALSDSALELQTNLAQQLNEIPGVERVLDIPATAKAYWGNAPNWRTKARESKTLSNLLLSTDHTVWGIVVWLEQNSKPKARKELVEAIHAATSKFASPLLSFHLAGTPIMNNALDSGSANEAKTFMPVAIAISLIVLAFMFRSITAVLAALLAVSTTVVWTLGLMAMAGQSINMVNAVLPSLLFILCLSSAVHLVSRYLAISHKDADRVRSVEATLQSLIPATGMSAVTTAAGFASLSVSTMQPVADFGTFAALGILIGWLCNLIVVPTLLSQFNHSSTESCEWKSTWQQHWGVFAARHASPMVLAGSLTLIVCTILCLTIRTESNVLEFFPKDSTIYRDYSFIAENLTGLYTVELDVAIDEFDEFETREALSSLADRIEQRPDIARVDTLESYTQSIRLKSDESTNAAAKDLFKFIRSKFRHPSEAMVHLRASVYSTSIASSSYDSLLEFIDNQAIELLPQDSTLEVTGIVSLLNQAQKDLVRTQVLSLSLAVLVVTLMIGLFTTSIKAALASLLPNILPVALMFALMAIFEIALDAATVMIAGVAIGIAVDDTIHFLVHYKKEMLSRRDWHNAASQTLSSVGRAVVFTSIVAASGFGILTLAEFRPIVYFGLLTSLVMLAALVGDILILPACVRFLRLWDKKG